MKVIIAIDSFKGCLTSAEANHAAAFGVRQACPDAEIVRVQVSDGGEGFLDAWYATLGGKYVETEVCDPLMRPHVARYLLVGEMAVIETAQAIGLSLLADSERNAETATSYGAGQLLAHAVGQGASRLVVALGGSATSDAGMGMLRALRHHSLDGVRITLATDVANPLLGPDGAAAVFAPQKGATPAMVVRLEARARRFARLAARRMNRDCSTMPGAGAAGGLGYALLQFFGAETKPGTDLLLDAIGFSRLVDGADLIITGEGAADRQTLMGKLPLGVLRHAGNVPVFLLAGCVSDCEQLSEAGFAQVASIHPDWPVGGAPPSAAWLSEHMHPALTKAHIAETVSNWLSRPPFYP